MKKFFGLIIAVILTTSCDDGEITLKSFDFENQSVQKCDTKPIVLKTKNEELLLINFTDDTNYNDAFLNEETGDTPRVFPISSSIQVIYRKYSANVNYQTTICGDLPPAIPTVTKEWTASGGNIVIETNTIYDTDGITPIGYTHNITFENINFEGSEDSFSFTSYIFGNHTT